MLRDLAAFERLWLICLLHRAAAPRLLVLPYLDDRGHGIFATRSPARSNPLSLTAVRLLGIEEDRLLIAGVDLLDGTPVLDIRPYVAAFDSFAVARAGWYEDKSAQGVVADDRFENRDPNRHLH